MRGDLNFVQRNSLSWLTVVMLVLGGAGSLHVLWQRNQLLDRIVQGERAISEMQQVATGDMGAGVSASQGNPQAQQEVTAFARNLQRPWERMLNELEAAARPDMQVLRLLPEADATALMVHGQANSSLAFLEYVARLRKNPLWRDVQPVNEEVTADKAGMSVSFQVMVKWGAQ